MTLLDYIAMRLGRVVDVDGYYGPQCTDLVNDYLHRVYAVGPLAGDASAFARGRLQGFQWVVNGPQNYPAAGAVMVWGGPRADVGLTAAGHCAVVVLADSMQLLSLDQNWPTGHAPQLVLHDYRGVLGWHQPLQARV